MKPCLIGIAGGSFSGKERVCTMILDQLSSSNAVVLKMKDFYKPLDQRQRELATKGKYNFDHPSAFDFELFEQIVRDLLSSKTVECPVFDIETWQQKSFYTIQNADIVIIHGIHAFYQQSIRDLMDLKVFVDVDSDERLMRFVLENVEREALDALLSRYLKTIKPCFEEFILPCKKYADVVIPRGDDNQVAIDLMTEHARDLLLNKE